MTWDAKHLWEMQMARQPVDEMAHLRQSRNRVMGHALMNQLFKRSVATTCVEASRVVACDWNS
eukprot:3061962-Rhodomonas_salina.1